MSYLATVVLYNRNGVVPLLEEIAAAEQQQAEAERQRAERLAARLRELDVEPE